MNSDTLILTIDGKPYEMKPEDGERTRLYLITEYAPDTMVTISDERTGKVYETIRIDELFNF